MNRRVAAVLLVVSGCSFVGMRWPSMGGTQPPRCSESNVLPAVDGVGALVGWMGTVLAVAMLAGRNSPCSDLACPHDTGRAGLVVFGPPALLYTGAVIYGSAAASRCTAAKETYATFRGEWLLAQRDGQLGTLGHPCSTPTFEAVGQGSCSAPLACVSGRCQPAPTGRAGERCIPVEGYPGVFACAPGLRCDREANVCLAP